MIVLPTTVVEGPPTGEARQSAQLPATPCTSRVRALATRYAQTVAVLVAGIALLLAGWDLASPNAWTTTHPWPAAAAAAGGWALAVAAWLYRRRWWGAVLVLAVTCVLPTAVVVPALWAGGARPDGLVLWGPVSTVFAVVLTMIADPDAVLGVERRHPWTDPHMRTRHPDQRGRSAPGVGGRVS